MGHSRKRTGELGPGRKPVSRISALLLAYPASLTQSFSGGGGTKYGGDIDGTLENTSQLHAVTGHLFSQIWPCASKMLHTSIGHGK